jgi:hypothetical protein
MCLPCMPQEPACTVESFPDNEEARSVFFQGPQGLEADAFFHRR